MATREECASDNEGMLFADGLDDALIGTVHIWGQGGANVVALYDYEKCVKILMDRDEMTREEATEFLDFNTLGAYVGPGTPAYGYLR